MTTNSSSSSAAPAEKAPKNFLDFRIGHDELIIRDRYETLSIANDILIGIVFLVGSFFFFSTSLLATGTWLFVIGSVLMLIRPTIRLARRFHLQRLHPDAPPESPRDF